MIDLNSFPTSGQRYSLQDCIESGAFGKIYIAQDSGANNKTVTIKVQEITSRNEKYLKDEYKFLRDESNHPNILQFYGVFNEDRKIWFVLEFCEGGSVLNLVNGKLQINQKMSEEHIAYILKETVQGLSYLHGKNVLHRNIRADNIFITKEGEIKLSSFHYCKILDTTFEKTTTCLGSPCWIAPEVILARKETDLSYDNRADVWSLGITAIELGDGKAPYQGTHPSRTLFQIVRNPPPTLYRQSNWTISFNDFINECLVKNPEYRPFIEELREHPFLTDIPENSYYLALELKSIITSLNIQPRKLSDDVVVFENFMKTGYGTEYEEILLEDLAALDELSEQSVLWEIQKRFNCNQTDTFIGDILLNLNSSKIDEIKFNKEVHERYKLKSRSENRPHIFAVADRAFQNALHHKTLQKIVLTGESGSGKTRNYLYLVNHLLYLGDNININTLRLKNAISLIHSLTHASTPYNYYSTRAILKTEIFYGNTGKTSGAKFGVNFLEKSRVSSTDLTQANFHFLYYVYDGLTYDNNLEKYMLNNKREYRYLRINPGEDDKEPRNAKDENINKYKTILDILKEFEFSIEQQEILFKIVAAILTLGDVRFEETNEYASRISNPEIAQTVSQLLDLDNGKFCWCLTNYCLIRDGKVVQRKNSCDQARDIRDVLSNTLYSRMVDYIFCFLNQALALGKTIFGEKYNIKIFDYFGFECLQTNGLNQLFINTFNEQMQHHFIQRVFKWEMADTENQDFEFKHVHVYNNKNLLNNLLGRDEGLFTTLDQATNLEHSGKYIIDCIRNDEKDYITVSKNMEFTITHFCGKVTYNSEEMPDKNRDFLPPEVIETLRLSNNLIIKRLFTNKLNKTGNIDFNFEELNISRRSSESSTDKISNLHRFSQSRRAKSLVALFKGVSLEILSELSIGAGSDGDTHFVRCIKTNLEKNNTFCMELVKQQIRAMTIVSTAKMRKFGFPYRVTFDEFLRRYQFLAFDFNENVDITKDNCRLLLIRLKMEGWAIGKNQVFLKYYNEEYLSRLYETQVKKVVKVQSILRSFLVKCTLRKGKTCPEHKKISGLTRTLSDDEAAKVIQEGYRNRFKKTNVISESMDEKDMEFIKPFVKKWKNNSIFHVLIQYRAAKFKELFHFMQQVHFYNQNSYYDLQKNEDQISLEDIDKDTHTLDCNKPPIMKINFLWNQIPFYDTSTLSSVNTTLRDLEETSELWDKPYQWKKTVKFENTEKCPEENIHLMNLPFNRSSNTSRKCQLKPNIPTPKINNTEKDLKLMVSTSIVNTKPTEENVINCNNTKPANKDFDYIKVSSNKKKLPVVDPIAELKIKSQTVVDSNDSPPFNFQGMLRKTNFPRDSIKRNENKNVIRFSLKTKELIDIGQSFTNGDSVPRKNDISLELCPGVTLQGNVFEI